MALASSVAAILVAGFFQVNAQIAFSTKLVLHNSRITWQSASNRCRDLHPKGRLVTLDTPAKVDLLGQLKGMDPWKTNISDYWIGLYKADLSSGDFTWTGECSPLGTWSNWVETTVNSTVERCARTRVSDDKWTLHNCTESAPFICEIPTEDQCSFHGITLTAVPTANDFADKKILVIRENITNSFCDLDCLAAVYNDLECWIWRMDGQYCMMYLANSTIIIDSVANASVHAFLKVCYSALLSTDLTSTGPNEIIIIPDDCSIGTSTEPETTAIPSSTNTQQTTSTATPQPTTTTTTSSSTSPTTTAVTTTTPFTTSTSAVDMISTEETVFAKSTTEPTDLGSLVVADDPKVISLEFPNVTTQTTTTTTTTEATTTAKRRVLASICECYCDSNTISLPAPTLSPEEKQEFVIQIIQSLTLNKSEISSVRRKFISAKDTRPSARNVGILGISLLSIVFGGIFILDIHGLIRDGKTLFGNIKSGLGNKDVSESYHLNTGE